MNKYVLKRVKLQLDMQIKLETTKNNYKQEFGYRLLFSLQKSKTNCVIGGLLKSLYILRSFEKV